MVHLDPPPPGKVAVALAIDGGGSANRHVAPVAIALTAAMMLGGGGSLFPFPEIVLQCLLAGLTLAWVGLRPDRLRQVPRGAWIIAALMLCVPLGQLLPLPPVVWRHLPGRSIEQAALELIGQGSRWRPLSLTVDRTIAAGLTMVAAAAMLVMAAAQDRRGRMILLATMAAIALLSVLVGAAQLSGGDGGEFRFYYPDEAFLDGFQAGHNAEADVLLIGLVMLGAAAADWAGPAWSGRAWSRQHQQRIDPRLLLGSVGGATLLLSLGVVLTASRSGIALLPIAIGAQALLMRRWLGLIERRLVIVVIAVVAVLVLAVAGLGQHGTLAQVWARFHSSNLRPQIWQDALFALHQYWPWGAGMGSFIPVFAAVERLEVVTSQYANRAHDDYLEFLIEAGVPGMVAFGLIIVRLARDGWCSWRGKAAGSSAQMLAGAASLIIIACHSLDDYPLRTMSLACMSAICSGVLLPVVQGAEPGNVI